MREFFKKHTKTILITAGVLFAALILGWLNPALLDTVPSVPLERWAENFISFLNDNFDPLFSFITFVITIVLNPVTALLTSTPPSALLILFAGVAYLVSGRNVAIFVALALLFMSAIDLFDETMLTLSLALTATIFALLIGIPLGILKAHFRGVEIVLDPVLDFMQTMPLFVYLIPAVLFFGIGNIPGIVATFIFATPPAVRLTALGIEQIPKELVESGHAFGATRGQFLKMVELPLAMPSIMTGVNQTIMLALSMVVVASMIGAEGLGQEVLRGITRLNVGQGIASGLGIVLLAMILDRITKKVWRK